MASRNTLDRSEIALIKAFIHFTRMNNQEILSYFSRPGRSLNHRVISEIRHERHFRDVEPATSEALNAFLARQPEQSPALVTDDQRRTLDRDQYWIGARVDYREIWSAYESGLAYINKFHSKPTHLLEIEFSNSNYNDPLFDHEAIFKTLKGLFHDLKKENMSADEYKASAPMFLYSVEKGSSIYRFMAGLRELLMHGLTLSDQKIMKAHLDNTQRRIDFIKRNFRSVDEESARRFIMARTTYEMDEGLERLLECGIKSVKISAEPVAPSLEVNNLKMIELKQPLDEPPHLKQKE